MAETIRDPEPGSYEHGRVAAANEGRSLLFGTYLFAIPAAFAFLILAMYQDAALVRDVSGYTEHRLVSPGIVKVVAGFLFANLATLLAATFKELLKPPPSSRWTWLRVACVAASAVAVVVAGTGAAAWFSTR